jgi:hypothetical protein
MRFVVVVVVVVVGVCGITPLSSTISSHIPSRKWVTLARCTVSHLKHTRDKLRKQQQQNNPTTTNKIDKNDFQCTSIKHSFGEKTLFKKRNMMKVHTLKTLGQPTLAVSTI